MNSVKRTRYKLLLINPNNSFRHGIYNTEQVSMPPMSLGIVAALTPAHWEVEILDEIFDPFEFRDADLIGLTALTSQVTRAYEIASVYREAKIPTVIGGIHASMMPEEALRFVDVVVKGEAESVWGEVIRDFERDNLKKIYTGTLMPMFESPFPRIDLYHSAYGLGNIQATRGCPMKCDFCSVHAFNGRKYRYRKVEDVVNEFTRIPQDRIYVVDDDFYGYGKKNAERAKEICKGIIKSGVKKDWYTFCSMELANDEEAMALMSEAGCRLVLFGIESEQTEHLQATEKHTNLKIGVDNFAKVYDAMHRNQIAVLGSFIFGLDTDTPETILNRARYIVESGIDCCQAGILTPLAGTRTYYKMLAENRITYNNFPKDWERFTFFNTVFQPKNMSQQELNDLMIQVWEQVYNINTIRRKYIDTLKSTKNARSAGWALGTNIAYGATVFENHKEVDDFYKLYKHITSVILNK